MTKLILASASIGRKELLSYLKIPFEVVASKLNEEKIIAGTPLETIKLRAQLKAEDVCNKLLDQKKSNDNKLHDVLILSADSGAIVDKKLIGKPKDYQDAVRIFSAFSGRTHEFITAIYFIRKAFPKDTTRQLDGQVLESKCHATSHVTFRRLSADDIRRYLSITDYGRFAGGYAIASAQDFITKIEGSVSNVIGLPLEKVIPILKELGFIFKITPEVVML